MWGLTKMPFFAKPTSFLKNPSKVWQNLNENKKRAACTNSDYKKMANLDDKGKFRQKWRVCQKCIKGLAKYSNEVTKSDKFGKKLSKV